MTALPLGQRKDNLPAEVTRFIGRRRELLAVTDAVHGHRLVTLRGVAGVGKTRLALHAAAALRDGFADGCWLVQLSALHTPELLARTVSEALGLPDEAGDDPARALAASLAGRELLLIFDTCEHLTGACAGLAALLLAESPGTRVLATSRAPLDLAGEHVVLIGPLELPADSTGGGGDPAAARADAVELFLDRARAAVPGFALTPENSAAVAGLCRRLDGIPLAIELAAVRLRGIPAQEILARLGDRFGVLGSTRTATSRHRSLRAAVSWSYELCTPAEQRLWAEISVFPGGFAPAAAERVCGRGSAGPLRGLAEKSVVQFTPGPGGGRYQMLDTMREFGAEHLDDAAAASARTRHRDYYLELAEQAAAGLLAAAQPDWLRRLGSETPNLRAALGFSFAAPGEAPAGLRMTRLLLPYWQMTGHFTEGRRWHELAVAAAQAAGSAAAGAPAGGRAGGQAGGKAGGQAGGGAGGQAGAAGDDRAWALFGAGVLAVQQGDLAPAGPLLDRAAALAAAAADEDLAARVTDARAILAFNSGDLEAARAGYEAALAVYERAGFKDPAALVTYGRLASVCLLTFDLERAAALCEQCLRRCAQTGEQWARGTALWVRGATRWLSGDNAAAIGDALASLQLKDELGDLHTTAMCFDLLSVCLVATGDVERAAVLYGTGDALWTLLNAPVLMGPGYAEIRRGAADAARGQLGGTRFDALMRYGASLPLDRAQAVAAGEAPAAPAPGPDRLTRREREVAALVAAGLGNREIAEQLFLSKRTVDSHMEHIFTKLGFSSRTRLASWVLEQGLRR